MFIGWTSEDSIFMVNVEQYLLHSRWKKLPKTNLYCFNFHVHKFWRWEKKKKFTAYVAFIFKFLTTDLVSLHTIIIAIYLVNRIFLCSLYWYRVDEYWLFSRIIESKYLFWEEIYTEIKKWRTKCEKKKSSHIIWTHRNGKKLLVKIY